MKKAIVTGATGAVGTALVNKLISENVETLVLVRKGGRVNKIPQNPLVKIAYCSLDEMADFQNENDEKMAFFAFCRLFHRIYFRSCHTPTHTDWIHCLLLI